MQLHELQLKIGKEIKKLRTMNEMTQEEVAEGLHLDRNAYGEIERGKTDIHLSRLVQIANFFAVEIEDLVGSNNKAVFYVAGTSNSNPIIIYIMIIAVFPRKCSLCIMNWKKPN